MLTILCFMTSIDNFVFCDYCWDLNSDILVVDRVERCQPAGVKTSLGPRVRRVRVQQPGRVADGRLVLDDWDVGGVLVFELTLEVELAFEVDENGGSFALVHRRDVVRPRRDGQRPGVARANLKQWIKFVIIE